MKQELRDVVFAAYGRSPIARAKKGSFADIHPATYGAETLKGVLSRAPGLDPTEIDDVIVGCAMTQGVQSGNFAKTIVLRAGLPDSVPAITINRYCSSGLQVIALASNAIAVDQCNVVVAGGVESMSLVSMLEQPEDRDRDLEAARPGAYFSMGITAENVAERYNVSRLEMEQMAVESHAKADAARTAGVFKREIIPITVKAPDGTQRTITADEGIRPGTNLAALAELKPVFKENGRVTAATSSQMSDGAAFVVLMSAEKAAELKLKPLARLAGFAVTGVACEVMGIGPIAAVPKVLALTGIKLDDIDVIELNEAFAAQAIPCIRELGLDPKKVNPRGGAMAFGHPLGATGTILTCKALSYLEDTGGKYALVTMCIGGGMGAAGIIEKL
jgi:acetyl-CoA acyltransferase